MDKDKILKQMCGFELNQADIKAICKLRALPSACLQSRTLLRHHFLSATGIEKAVAALDQRQILCLHLLAAAGGREGIRFFTRLYKKAYPGSYHHTFTQQYRTFFSMVKTELIRKGLLLFAEKPKDPWQQTAVLERLRFMFPAEFAAFLPPPAKPLKVDTSGANIQRIDFLREKLVEIIETPITSPPQSSKKKVIKQHAVDTELNVFELFKELGIHAIPANVKQELVAWAGHADNFVVYQGFGLLEGKMDKDTAGRFTAVSIAADTHIVRKPQKLFKHLELAQKVPIYVKHSDRAFKSLGDTVKSKYTDKRRAKKPGSRKKRRFTLKCTVHLILEFPDKDMFEAFTNALLDKGYALDTNKQARTVSYSQKDETIIKDVLNSLKKKFPAVIKNA